MVVIKNNIDPTWENMVRLRKGKTEPLPEKMVSHELYSDNYDKLMLAWEKVLEAYARLRQLNMSRDAIPHHPKEITLERLTVFVNEKKIGVNEQTKKYYDGILFRAKSDIQIIKDFFGNYPKIEVELDEGTIFFERALIIKNRHDVLIAKSMINVPKGDGIPTVAVSFGPQFRFTLVDSVIKKGKAGEKIDLGINNVNYNI